MTRVSRISAREDFEIEHHREAILDRRWKRRCAVFLCFALALAILVESIRGSPLLPILLGWL